MPMDIENVCWKCKERIAQLLMQDNPDNWESTARWLDKRALESGVDIWAVYESPELWAGRFIDCVRHKSGFIEKIENMESLDSYECTEEIFWHLMPD